ncbi:transporter substrate-binding domain-containing protein [Nonomuraea sp. NPDC050691]|uniref:serine/threonine-protein kinase n=1 Tax=Nonomuraea sp. NPDC050691 TaxID=3155661 RepID=UPI0033F96DE5
MPQISPLVTGDPAELGSFRLTGRIGEGGQGIVYLGVDEQGERAAIKLLHVKFSGDQIARSRFARELKAAKRVASFCTARVIEADLDGDTPYIASEYIDGRALRDIVDTDGPLRGTVLDRLAIGTATALTAIHHASIIHRDFKPDNVLIAADGPRVVDFGIARIIDSTGTITSRAIGTPAYMAPEQIAGDDVGPYTDVFAWGATIAFAASGKAAFEGNSIAVVLNRILNHEVDVSMMPEPLRGVVRSALSKSPEERPSADQILLRLLGQPESSGASTAVLTRGVQVATDDTTPFLRVSSTLAPPGAPRTTTGGGAQPTPGTPAHTGGTSAPTGGGFGYDADDPNAETSLIRSSALPSEAPPGTADPGHPIGHSAQGGRQALAGLVRSGAHQAPAEHHAPEHHAPERHAPEHHAPEHHDSQHPAVDHPVPAGHQPPARRTDVPPVPPTQLGGRGRSRRRKVGWITLAAALALVVAAAAVAVLDGWPQRLLGQDASGRTTPPDTFASVVDKVASTGKLVIGVKGDLPGIGLQRDGGFEGFDVELGKRIAAELGAKSPSFVRVTVGNRDDMLADGSVDLVLATYSIDKSGVEFAGPYYLAHQDVLVHDGAGIEKIEDLKGRKVCAVNSPSVGKVQDLVDVEPVMAGNYADCMDLLRSGRVDAVPGDDLILAGFAGREPLRYKILGAKLSSERYAVGIRGGDVKACKAVNGVIADFYRTGVMKELLTRYFARVDFSLELKSPVMETCG